MRTGARKATKIEDAYVELAACVGRKKLRLHLHPDETGGFWVDSPDLQGLATQGETTDEAVANGIDAALTILEAHAQAASRPILARRRTGS